MATKAGRPTVFISYAHENAALRASVKALADWLGENGCVVQTDHPFADRAPPEGWTTWMRKCIRESNIVLIVCTAKLKARFEKDAPVDEGQGATYEGSIVTRAIYEAAMRNTKFFPVVPDAGSRDNIPDILRDWSNDHWFPSGNERIRRMVFDEPAAVDSSAASPDETAASGCTDQRFGCDQERLVADKLGAADARQFLSALQNDFRKRFGSDAPKDAAAMVHWFADRESAEVQQVFFLVRRAIGSLSAMPREDLRRVAAEEAAVALYCLAAMRLVDTAAASASELRPGQYLLYVPSSERVICAIIATALFGGEIHLKPTDASGAMQPEYVFDVPLPAAGDHTTEAFECAAYAAVFRNQMDALEIVLKSGALTSAQRHHLAARIDDVKDQKRSIALVVHGLSLFDAAAPLAKQHQLPVLLPASDLPTSEFTTKLLGMNSDRLTAEIGLLWPLLAARPGGRP